MTRFSAPSAAGGHTLRNAPRAVGDSPKPLPVRTLDALHLASVTFLRERGKDVAVATYDERMTEACRAMGLRLAAL